MYRIGLLFFLLFLPLSASASSGVRAVAVAVYDQGETDTSGGLGTFRVDTRQDDCAEEGEDEDLEAFFDTALRVTVINSLNQDVRFRSLSYRLRFKDDSEKTVRVKVKGLGIARGSIVSRDSERQDVTVLIFDKEERVKGFPKSSVIFPVDAGFRRVRAVLKGKTSSGKSVRVRFSFMISADNHDRC